MSLSEGGLIHDGVDPQLDGLRNQLDDQDAWLAEQELARRALHDELTGLPNRTLLVDRLTTALGRAARGDGVVAVMYYDLDQFKAVLSGTARAIAEEPEVELAFTADAPSQSGKHIKIPMPARALPAEQVAEARGFADGFALRLKHHDSAMHLRHAPAEAVARAANIQIE